MTIQKHISVFGLGYVGCVCAAALAHLGHVITGVDVLSDKVEKINNGLPTVIEPGLAELLAEGKSRGLVSATTYCKEAVSSTTIGFVCVGTPSTGNGHLNLESLFAVVSEIGGALREVEHFFTLVVRSTVAPGTSERVVDLLERVSGKIHGSDFGVVSNPEFLREGNAIHDFLHPELTVIGSTSERGIREVAELYAGISANIRTVDVSVAEMIKYVSNSYHALKVAFANEIGAICRKSDIDAHAVMDLFCEDRSLNISPAYLRPGTAYGGSCLPKDLKGLLAIAHDHYLEMPILSNIERSNSEYKNVILDAVLNTGKRRVGFVGLSFKANTDDLRSSPTVELAERLIGKGFWVLIFDRNVRAAKLIGANKAEIERRIPKIHSYMTNSLLDLFERTDVLILSQGEDDLAEQIALHPEKIFIDLVRIDPCLRTHANYIGIAW